MDKVTLLISSCDIFSDCWEPYMYGLRKYWPECDFPVYIISNYEDIKREDAKTIKIGEDKNWSQNLLLALEQVETPYIFYTHEDFWIKSRVHHQEILDYVELLEQGIAYYIRLYPGPEPDIDYEGDMRLGRILESSDYRTSLQAALWRKDILKALIDPSENPWKFEINGTVRSRKYKNKFLSVKAKKDGGQYGVNYVCTAINKGLWSKEAKKFAKDEGLDIDFSNRPHETWLHDLKRAGKFGAFSYKSLTFFGRAIRKPFKLLKRK